LTNDGQLAHELLSPRKHVPKSIMLLLTELLQQKMSMCSGKALFWTTVINSSFRAFILKSDPYSEVEIVIYEGKFHQVKRMFEAVGKKVKYLRRIGMGKLKLDETLEPGDVRELTDEEMLLVKEVEKVN